MPRGGGSRHSKNAGTMGSENMTYHERRILGFGTIKERLGKETVKDFDSCALGLTHAVVRASSDCFPIRLHTPARCPVGAVPGCSSFVACVLVVTPLTPVPFLRNRLRFFLQTPGKNFPFFSISFRVRLGRGRTSPPRQAERESCTCVCVVVVGVTTVARDAGERKAWKSRPSPRTQINNLPHPSLPPPKNEKRTPLLHHSTTTSNANSTPRNRTHW
jgi:hypothetical protein